MKLILIAGTMTAALVAQAALADTSDMRIAFSNNYAGNSWRQAMLKSYDLVTQKAVTDGIVAAADVFMLTEAFLYEEQTRRGVSHRATSTSSATSPTIARSATSAAIPARSTSTSAMCRSRCATSCARRQKEVQPRHRGVDVLPERDRPGHDQARQDVMIDVGFRAQRLAYAVVKKAGLARAQTRAAAVDDGHARRSRRR